MLFRSHLRLLTNELIEKIKELEATNRRLLEVQEAERCRLARELHDELGQLLATVNNKLHAAKQLAGPHSLVQLEACSVMVQQATEQVRKLAFDLRPAILDVLGLEPALHFLADRHRQQTGVPYLVQVGQLRHHCSPQAAGAVAQLTPAADLDSHRPHPGGPARRNLRPSAPSRVN